MYLLPLRSNAMHVMAAWSGVPPNSNTRRPVSKSQTFTTWNQHILINIHLFTVVCHIEGNSYVAVSKQTSPGKMWCWTSESVMLSSVNSLTDPSEQLTTWRNSSLYPQHITGSLCETVRRLQNRGLQRKETLKWMTARWKWSSCSRLCRTSSMFWLKVGCLILLKVK